MYDDWLEVLDKVDLAADFYGNWDFTPYDKKESRRMTVVARKRNGVALRDAGVHVVEHLGDIGEVMAGVLAGQ